MSNSGAPFTKAVGVDAPEPGRDLNTDTISTQIFAANKAEQLVAYLAVTEGPGRGNMLAVFAGTNAIGRSERNRIILNFGDQAISRDSHALVTHDPASGAFRLYDGGKPNRIRLNGAPVEGDVALKVGDMILIGETTLRLQPA